MKHKIACIQINPVRATGLQQNCAFLKIRQLPILGLNFEVESEQLAQIAQYNQRHRYCYAELLKEIQFIFNDLEDGVGTGKAKLFY